MNYADKYIERYYSNVINSLKHSYSSFVGYGKLGMVVSGNNTEEKSYLKLSKGKKSLCAD